MTAQRPALQAWDAGPRSLLATQAPGGMPILAGVHRAPSAPDIRYISLTCGEQSGPLHLTDTSPPELAACQCTGLKPLLRNVVDSMLRLKERLRGFPRGIAHYDHAACDDDDPMRTLQWLLERLRAARCDLDDLLSLQKPGEPFRDLRVAQSLPYFGGLKRSAGAWDDSDEIHKRTRLGSSVVFPDIHGNSSRCDRMRRARPDTYSPTTTASFQGTFRPRSGSPDTSNRYLRALPSPSSMALPRSAASVPPAPAASFNGPSAMSYHAASSAKSVSTDSATLAHVADLQHQVTLKSQALQSLQAEYESLLQKLQREKAKRSTIERKTTVADRELNELTGKVEGSAEQLKQVTTQLEASETKRENERLEAQQVKNQWSRMLEMSGRLQTKVDAERQRLQEANEELLARISQFEEDGRQTGKSTVESSSVLSHASVSTDMNKASNATPGSEAVVMRQHIVALNARIGTLRTALGQVRTHSASLDEQTRAWHRQNTALNDLADAALKTDYA